MNTAFQVSDVKRLLCCPDFRQKVGIPKGVTAEQLTEQMNINSDLHQRVLIYAAEVVLAKTIRAMKKKRVLDFLPKFLHRG
jgi:hypothetical protein